VSLPDLGGRTAVVTGANAGLGFQIALALAGAGCRAVLACRDAERAERAAAAIRARVSGADVTFLHLDLADLNSVRRFATACRDRADALDLLVNNAGVVLVPRRHTTVDGFELHLGVNHLGHFALTGLLLPALLARPGARVVTMSSIEVRWARLAWDDLNSERRYGRDRAYAQSKLANLVFALELQRRLDAAGADVLSVAAHPGWAATDQQQGPLISALTRRFGQPAARGALPALYAATATGVAGGDLVGPGGWFGMRGEPVRVRPPVKARDTPTGCRLWTASEELTGVRYPLGG
jgi:NAD(P)-dependent dehydrogenase (short-subunit alcohol dehydrogenase family)